MIFVIVIWLVVGLANVAMSQTCDPGSMACAYMYGTKYIGMQCGRMPICS
jgi:hypothetical protein